MDRVRAVRVMRRGACSLALTLGLVFAGPRGAMAQTGTVHLQAALLDDAAAAYTLGIRYTAPRTAPALPRPGETSEEEVEEWLFTAMVGAGLSRGKGGNPENGGTVVGQVGMAYRTGALVEQVGLVAYANTNPWLIGPAVTARVAIVEVAAGGGWRDGGSGLAWFVAGALSWELIRDLGR